MWSDSDSDVYLDSDSYSDDDDYHYTPAFNIFTQFNTAQHRDLLKRKREDMEEDKIKKIKQNQETYKNYKTEYSDPDKLKSMNVIQLKSLCQYIGLKATKKQDMIDDILRHLKELETSEQSKEQMVSYHRGMVNYSLPPYTIVKILGMCWSSPIIGHASKEPYMFRWKLSLGLVSKEFRQFIKTQFDSLSLTYARSQNLYEKDSKLKFKDHLSSPYASIRQLRKLDVYERDLLDIFGDIGKDIRTLKSLETLIVHKSVGYSGNSYMKNLMLLPALISLKLYAIPLGNPSITLLKKLTSLKKIDIQFSGPDHFEAYDLLEPMKKLESIKIKKQSNSKASLFRVFKDMPSLRRLSLFNGDTLLTCDSYIPLSLSNPSASQSIYRGKKVAEQFKDFITDPNVRIECILLDSSYISQTLMAQLTLAPFLTKLEIHEYFYDTKQLVGLLKQTNQLPHLQNLIIFLKKLDIFRNYHYYMSNVPPTTIEIKEMEVENEKEEKEKKNQEEEELKDIKESNEKLKKINALESIPKDKKVKKKNNNNNNDVPQMQPTIDLSQFNLRIKSIKYSNRNYRFKQPVYKINLISTEKLDSNNNNNNNNYNN